MKKIMEEYKNEIKSLVTNPRYIIPIIFVAILSYGFLIYSFFRLLETHKSKFKNSTLRQSRNHSTFNTQPSHPTVPSNDTLRSFCASTANSMGSLLSTSLA